MSARKFFSALIMLLFVPVISAQQKDPAAYSFSKDLNTQVILKDDFSKFSNYWLLGIEENSWSETIEDGKLVFQSLTGKSKEDLLPVIIDQSRDFQIEATIQFVEGKMELGYGLQWGKAVNPSRQYDFLLTGAGHFSIDKYDGKFSDYVPFTISETVNRYAANKLTIRKVSDKYYFFLNEKNVHTMPFEPFFGNMIGFQVGDLSTITIDNIEVIYLDQAEKETSKVLIMDYKFDITGDKVAVGKPVTLTVNMRNAGKKDADDLKITCKLPDNIEVVDFRSFNSLKAGEEQLLMLQFYATKDYANQDIAVKFDIDGADITNVNDINLTVALDKPVTSEIDKTVAQTYSDFRGGDDPLKGLNVAQAMKSVQVGEYYALIIGIDQYTGEWPMLKNAVSDAKSVAQTLSSRYNFQYMKTLFDKEATRDNILAQFEWLMKSVKPNDNVLIYYSGHGEYVENMNKGFWVPVDASSKSISRYISNEDIKAFLSGINSKHTLLVTDACFSGDIFRGKTITIPYENSTKYYNKVYSLNSRKALTSGGVEPVMDKGKDGHSVFAYYFLQALSKNSEKFCDAGQIFESIKIPVVNNSYQEPLYSPIHNAGDEGGQFIFMLKQ